MVLHKRLLLTLLYTDHGTAIEDKYRRPPGAPGTCESSVDPPAASSYWTQPSHGLLAATLISSHM
ncbi:hypothetical protein J6590_020992 [Homalodisca vitripennis]|nr:hypothetical protein J6590_020992 [Homalodisca vitripennis]